MDLTKKKAWRNKLYGKFVSGLNCCITGTPGPSDPHHYQRDGCGTMGGKASDEWQLPLVHRLHQELHQIGREAFWKKWRVDPEEIITRTQAEWVRRGGKREWE